VLSGKRRPLLLFEGVRGIKWSVSVETERKGVPTNLQARLDAQRVRVSLSFDVAIGKVEGSPAQTLRIARCPTCPAHTLVRAPK